MVLKLVALGLTGLILVPSGAHLLELPAKMALGREDYLLVQSIYAGWALFAVPILATILADVGLAVSLRRSDPVAARWASAAAALVALTLGVFFVWVFPGNRATGNWTSLPDDWETLRRNWEYGHAANAVILFLALLSTGRAAIGCVDRPR